MTQLNCANDYYAYCSQFTVGSKELRVCMRKAGPKLSKACLDSLIADGEVSKQEVAKRKEEITAAKSPKKESPTAEQKVVVEAPPKQERMVLDEPTFAALKKREPRFIEAAEASDAPKSAEEPKAQDPRKIELKVVADPEMSRDAKADEAGDVADKRKVVDKPKSQKAIAHSKSKAKVAAQKAGGTKEKSRPKAQTASQ